LQRIYWGRSVAALIGFALLYAGAASCLPDNGYQRFQLLDGTIYESLRWAYERIHFDPRPVDVAIVGPSRSQLGFSASRIEQRLAQLGKPAHVANFSIIADGRNVEWAIINELYKTKSPDVIVVAVDETPYGYGHPAFKYVAPATDIAFPPTPLLHNYFYDVVYLPFRQMKLFGALLFPDFFKLTTHFDTKFYEQEPTDFTVSHRVEDGRWIDMEQQVPRAILLQQARKAATPKKRTIVPRLLGPLIEGDDHAYIEKIARLANRHGTRLIFVYMPIFNGDAHVSDETFLSKSGLVLNAGDLAQEDKLFEGWAHFNHAGALVVSDRLADAIAHLNR
jgi:hypothetical protein